MRFSRTAWFDAVEPMGWDYVGCMRHHLKRVKPQPSPMSVDLSTSSAFTEYVWNRTRWPVIMPNVNSSLAYLYPERRAPKAEDLHVPGSWPKTKPQATEQAPKLPLDLFVDERDRRGTGQHNAHLRAAVQHDITNARAAWHSRGLASRPSLRAALIGCTIGAVYSMTFGVVTHEVLGHSIIGYGATNQFRNGRQYWTDVVQDAARAGLNEVPPDVHYWQADWVDNMALHGGLLGTAIQLTSFDGHVVAPNDTAWPWNNPNDAALQTVLNAFALNKTNRFDHSLGFVDPTSADGVEKTSFGRRLGDRGIDAWVNLAGSVPGFALVSATWLAAQNLEDTHPFAATVLANIGQTMHYSNVGGMLGDLGGAGRAASDYIVLQVAAIAALLWGSSFLPNAIDAASRSKRGVNKNLVSDEHALKTWIRRASNNPTKLAQLNTLLAAYPGRSKFNAKSDVESVQFARQLMDCYAYLTHHLSSELDAIKRTEAARWLETPSTKELAAPFDAAKMALRGAQLVLSATSAASMYIEPGKPFSGHVALAVPAIAIFGLASTLTEATRNQAIRSQFNDPASLDARIERVLDRLF